MSAYDRAAGAIGRWSATGRDEPGAGPAKDLEPVLLARLQFAFSISFHILFPAFTIGLAAWLVVPEAAWLTTGSPISGNLSRFWTKIFAVSFGMGVVSGIVMSFQFGTNWSTDGPRSLKHGGICRCAGAGACVETG